MAKDMAKDMEFAFPEPIYSFVWTTTEQGGSVNYYFAGIYKKITIFVRAKNTKYGMRPHRLASLAPPLF